MRRYYDPLTQERNRAALEYTKEVVTGVDDAIMEMVIAQAFRDGFDHRIKLEAETILAHIRKWIKE